MLTPVVSIGSNGLTDNVLAEIERQLERHELIKIGVQMVDRNQFRNVAQQCAHATGSTLIDVIGRRFVLYRKKSNDDQL